MISRLLSDGHPQYPIPQDQESKNAVRDEIKSIKDHLRKGYELDEALEWLLTVGEETKYWEVFIFTEYCKWLLCYRDRVLSEQAKKVARLSGKEKIKNLLQEEGYLEMDGK
jgi:hypothetical protein